MERKGVLRSRLSNLRRFIFKYRFPIIAISQMSPNIRLSGYDLLFSERRGEFSSRIVLAIRKDFVFVRHHIAPGMTNEYVIAAVQCGKTAFTVIAGYMPPSVEYNCHRLENQIFRAPESRSVQQSYVIRRMVISYGDSSNVSYTSTKLRPGQLNLLKVNTFSWKTEISDTAANCQIVCMGLTGFSLQKH